MAFYYLIDLYAYDIFIRMHIMHKFGAFIYFALLWCEVASLKLRFTSERYAMQCIQNKYHRSNRKHDNNMQNGLVWIGTGHNKWPKK